MLMEALDKSLRGVVRSIDIDHVGTRLIKIVADTIHGSCRMPIRSAKQVKPELNKPQELVMTSALFLIPERVSLR